MGTKNVGTLPNFTSDYAQIASNDAQAGAIREGLGYYKALAMMLNGDLLFSADKGTFIGPKGSSITKVCKGLGWNVSSVTKAATVIRQYVEGFADLDATELREQVIALVTNYGSVNAAYETIVPPKGKDENGQPQPKSARELLTVALRRHLSDGGDVASFINLVGEVVGTWEADNAPKGEDQEAA